MSSDPMQSPEQILSEFRASPAGKGVAGRSDVARLAKENASQAIVVARAIEHPWYRCQALASIVEVNLAHPRAEDLLAESLAAAYSQPEPNRVASVAFWPLRLLVQVGLPRAAVHTRRLLDIIAQEPHGLRRLDGLCSILIAVMPVPELRSTVLPLFVETAGVSAGWRTERIIDHVIHALLPFDRESSISLLASRPVTRYTRRSRALLGPTQDALHAGT